MKLMQVISVALHELLIAILNCCLVCSSCCLYAEIYRYFHYFYPIKIIVKVLTDSLIRKDL